MTALADPRLSAQMADIETAEAVLVLAVDPLHEMPILDLRIRKAVRREGVSLVVASERPTTLDGGADAAVRFPPGGAVQFLNALVAAVGGDQPEGPEATEAGRVAAALGRDSEVVVVWGSRLGSENEGAPLVDLAEALRLAERDHSGLIELPEAANGRGLREAGCVPVAGPGFGDAPAGRCASEIRAALESEELTAAVLANVDPIRDWPNGDAWSAALQNADFVVAFSMFENGSTSHADVVFPAESHAEKEGTVTHPDGRLQRLRPNIPHPGDVRPGWRVLVELAAALDHETGLDSAPEVFEALAAAAPIYAGLTYDEIGGTGIRWQDRDAAKALVSDAAGAVASADSYPPRSPTSPSDATAAPGGAEEAEATDARRPSDNSNLRLGTYRDLWSGEVTDRNPALRFLAPEQRLELAPSDAERLGVEHGQAVAVSSNGTSVQARVAIRERMRPGAGFLIEGTAENNANLLAGAETIEVRALTPEETM